MSNKYSTQTELNKWLRRAKRLGKTLDIYLPDRRLVHTLEYHGIKPTKVYHDPEITSAVGNHKGETLHARPAFVFLDCGVWGHTPSERFRREALFPVPCTVSRSPALCIQEGDPRRNHLGSVLFLPA
jgi:hypothetical protein